MVHRTKLLSAEYQALFKRYLEDRVPNQGSGFFGQWAWHAAREKEVRDILKKQKINHDKD